MGKIKFLFLILFATTFSEESYGQEIYIPLKALKLDWQVYHGFNVTNKIVVSKLDTISSPEDTSIYSLNRVNDTTYDLKINCTCCSPYFNLNINSHWNGDNFQCFLNKVNFSCKLELGYLDSDTVKNKYFTILTEGGLRASCNTGIGYDSDLHKFSQLEIQSYEVILKKDDDTIYFKQVVTKSQPLDWETINKLVSKNSKHKLTLLIKSVFVKTTKGSMVRVNPINVFIKPD
ncbi:MAG TPA: hypothetical protein VK177_15335 [Flavobacteriales bacterium]|nr:hypothetical protein [Flavobacteriales bacterium]